MDAGAPVSAEVPLELGGRALVPNRGTPLDVRVVEEVRVNTSAVERRAAQVGTRRTVKKDWQAAWLLRAIACMDLTTLSGDDSAERVRRLCAKARRPLAERLVSALDIEGLGLTVGAVCVYHAFVETAVRALEGSGIPVAAVSTGDEVEAGALLGEVRDLYGDVIEEVRAPSSGVLLFLTTSAAVADDGLLLGLGTQIR